MEKKVRRSVAVLCQLMMDNAALMLQVSLHGEHPSTVERFTIGESGKFLSIFDKYNQLNIFIEHNEGIYRSHHPFAWMTEVEAEWVYNTALSYIAKVKSAEVEYAMLPEDMKSPLPTPAEKSFTDLYRDFR